MANQIIACPPTLLRSLVAAIDAERRPAVGGLRFELLGGLHGFDAVCFHADDPRLVLSTSAHAEPRVFVLLLTCEQSPSPTYQPLPLPDDLAIEMLDRLIRAAPELPDLEGHERLALADLLLAAQAAANRAPLRHAPRGPENEYEERILASAIELETCCATRLGSFDGALAAFRGRALQSGLASTLRSLSAQGPVIDALTLQPAGTDRFRLSGGRRARRRLAACRRRADADRLTLDSARAASAACEFAAMPCTGRSVYLHVARGSGNDRNWRAESGIWRTGTPRRERGLPRPVPTEALFTAMRLFDGAFDWHLLANAHPLVRTALVASELARLQPLSRDNGRFIVLMVTAALEEFTAGPLPVLPALHRQRGAFAAALSAAVEHGQLAPILDTLIDLASVAIGIGDRIIQAVAPGFAEIVEALVANGIERHQAMAAARAVLGAVLLEEDDLADPPERAQASHLALLVAQGRRLIDPIAAGDAALWSAAAVRQALAGP